TLFRPADVEPGATAAARCATGSAEERGRVEVVRWEQVSVAGEEVDALYLRRVTTLSGRTRGRTRHDVWLHRASGIPVRLVMRTRTRNDSPIGEVTYVEEVELRLESLEPRR
ncbi:MAG: hypothetical protein RMM28_03135, partial [Thermoleophilia bacterium]|nr:hypothetical protein [Gaiellaceae bacterium]MDW8338114.1 hypothetical protein [Thermoleophilia bacterium]